MDRERGHLRRLDRLSVHVGPVYFVTFCTRNRLVVFNSPETASPVIEALRESPSIHGWAVGRFVVMPDHVHILCWPARADAKELSRFIGDLKRYTSRRLAALGIEAPVWQREFFDRVLRDMESYAPKWEYIRMNPVRAGLVQDPDAWPWQGELCDLL